MPRGDLPRSYREPTPIKEVLATIAERMGFPPLDNAVLLRRSQVFKEFLVHYHHARPHRGLDRPCPDAEPVVLPLPVGGKMVGFDRLGGLLREYSWAA